MQEHIRCLFFCTMKSILLSKYSLNSSVKLYQNQRSMQDKYHNYQLQGESIGIHFKNHRKKHAPADTTPFLTLHTASSG